MKTPRAVAWLMLLTGCATMEGPGGSGPASPPQARPAVKKELPWLIVPDGRMRTTLFYGPWQCRQTFMNQCQSECASAGYKLMGCMWLADVKLDWEGQLPVLSLAVGAGSRYGVYHCIYDLWHGGDPVDPNNLIPVQPDVHAVFNEQYPLCYGGKAPWNSAGLDMPYTDD